MSTWADSRPERPSGSRDQCHDAVIEQTAPRRDRRERPGGPLIVVGIDTSEASPHALAYAAGAARRMHAALLVAHISTLAGSAYSWLHRLTGSTAARLLRRARCPVTVVP
jgi:nucleotide-binding universal stress UspA family protein